MENNKDKGCKNRFRGKNENGDIKRELILAEPGQCYAQVTKMLGNGRLEALCSDNVKRLCHIRGKLRNRVWINTSDIILIGLRYFQDERADVILKYTAHEVKVLKKTDETLKNINITDTSAFCQDQGDDDIIFDERSGNDGKDKPKGFSFKRRENSNRNSTITKDQFLILPMEKTNN